MTGGTTTEKSTSNPLEQFVLLAKTAKGAAALELIRQAVETPGVHVFGELLDMPNIKELENGPYVQYWNTLNLFAYGTYKQYLENKDKVLELTPIQKKKLQHLTIVTLATKSKCIPYSVLLEELDIKNVRDLEDLIIEAIYADIIHGKLDQKNSQLEVDYAGLGRDVRPGDAGIVAETLASWGHACDAVLACIEEQVVRANIEKQKATFHKDRIQRDIANIKKSLAAQAGGGGVQEADVAGGSSSAGGSESGREALPVPPDPKKKQQKVKGIRGSGSITSFFSELNCDWWQNAKMKKLLVAQEANHRVIYRFWENIKKSSKTKFTKSYLIGRRIYLENAWATCEAQDKRIFITAHPDYLNLEYFMEDKHGVAEIAYLDAYRITNELLDMLSSSNDTTPTASDDNLAEIHTYDTEVNK